MFYTFSLTNHILRKERNHMSITIKDTNLSFGSLTPRTSTTKIILHHADASTCDAATIHQWHLNNGWSGIGYHFLVRKNGTIERGRPEPTIGAHTSGSNSNSIGICFEGRYMTEDMPDVQKKAGQELIAWLKAKYGINKVLRHRDVCATNCPGNKFPFAEIANATGFSSVTTPRTSSSSTQNNINNWIARLQSECNIQGFSHQIVDGVAGKNTLAGCPMMRQGTQGNITRLLQERLISLGYSCGPAGIDGIFGSQTKAAVIHFQKKNKLSPDGIVGVNTWQKLLGL